MLFVKEVPTKWIDLTHVELETVLDLIWQRFSKTLRSGDVFAWGSLQDWLIALDAPIGDDRQDSSANE